MDMLISLIVVNIAQSDYQIVHLKCMGFTRGTSGKELTCQCRRLKRFGFDPWVGKIPLEEGMATHPSILAWRIPWTEEPGELQSMGLHRVGHD